MSIIAGSPDPTPRPPLRQERMPGRFVDRASCPSCRQTWRDGTPMRTVILFEGYGVGRDRGIIASRCLLCGETWAGEPVETAA